MMLVIFYHTHMINRIVIYFEKHGSKNKERTLFAYGLVRNVFGKLFLKKKKLSGTPKCYEREIL